MMTGHKEFARYLQSLASRLSASVPSVRKCHCPSQTSVKHLDSPSSESTFSLQLQDNSPFFFFAISWFQIATVSSSNAPWQSDDAPLSSPSNTTTIPSIPTTAPRQLSNGPNTQIRAKTTINCCLELKYSVLIFVLTTMY